MRFHETEYSFHDDFLTGVKTILDPMGWGSQVKLAKAAGISPSYLNDLLKKRRNGTEEVRRAISKALKKSYSEILEIGGEQGVSVSNFELYESCNAFPVYSERRAACIYRFAAEQAGIKDSEFFAEAVLVRVRPTGWVDYLDGGIDDGELLAIAEQEIRKIRGG